MSRVFFTDRDLGKQFPAILRAAGILAERHADHFAHDTPDDVWLPVVARHGWIVLTHDRRIRYKPNERDGVMVNGAAMFVLVGAVPHHELARAFVATYPAVESFLERNAPPFIAKLYRGPFGRGGFGRGRVQMDLSARQWLR